MPTGRSARAATLNDTEPVDPGWPFGASSPMSQRIERVAGIQVPEPPRSSVVSSSASCSWSTMNTPYAVPAPSFSQVTVYESRSPASTSPAAPYLALGSLARRIAIGARPWPRIRAPICWRRSMSL